MTPHQNQNPARNARPRVLPVRFEFTEPETVPIHVSGTTISPGSPAIRPMLPVGNCRRVKEPVAQRYGGVNLLLLLETPAAPRRSSRQDFSQEDWKNK